MKSISLNEKLRKICELTENDVTNWEWSFITSMLEMTLKQLTNPQIEIVCQIYHKHFIHRD